MNVPNHERKTFRDMTPGERAAIVEAHMVGMADILANDVWMHADKNSLLPAYAYRTRPRQLVIPWEHIKEEYKWAALCKNGRVIFFTVAPRGVEFDGWSTVHSFDATNCLNINTTGIDWRESLTARPEGV